MFSSKSIFDSVRIGFDPILNPIDSSFLDTSARSTRVTRPDTRVTLTPNGPTKIKKGFSCKLQRRKGAGKKDPKMGETEDVMQELLNVKFKLQDVQGPIIKFSL